MRENIMATKTFNTLLNEKSESIRKNFVISDDGLVAAIADALVSSSIAEGANLKKTESFRSASENLDTVYGKAWIAIAWNSLGKDLAAGYAKIAGQVDLTVNKVKELHQVYLAFTAEEIGGSRQTWQNIKEWSLYCESAKAKHPEVKKALEKAKAEAEAKAEASETPDDAVAKVINILSSQYQYLGKIEGTNESIESLMFELSKILESNGVDMLSL